MDLISRTSLFMIICTVLNFWCYTHAWDVSGPVCKWDYSTNTCEKDPSKIIQLLTKTNKIFALLMRCQYATTQSTCNNMSQNTCIWENNACHISSKKLIDQIDKCFYKNSNQISKCQNELQKITENNNTWIDRSSVAPTKKCKDTIEYISFFGQDTCKLTSTALQCPSYSSKCRYGSSAMQAYQLVSDLRYIMGVQQRSVSISLQFLETYLDIKSGNLQLYDKCNNIKSIYNCKCQTQKYQQCYNTPSTRYSSSPSTSSNSYKDKKDTKDIIIIIGASLFGLLLLSIYSCKTIFRENARNVISSINGTSQNVEMTARTTNEEEIMVTAVTVDILERLPKQEYQVQKGHETSESICCICLEKLQEGDVSTVLACQHQFHKDCLDQWIKTKGRKVACPLCNNTLQNTQLSQQ